MVLRRAITITFGFLLFSSIVFLPQVAASDTLQPEEHEPIIIDGNDSLVATALAEGWLGTGSEGSPIIISGLSIKSETYGIYIANVNIHFRIEDCIITESEPESGCLFGILLDNCSHASIEECTVWNSEMGICLSNSDCAYVYRTEVFDSFFGIFVNYSSSVWLHSLDIVMCKIGVRLNHTTYAYVDQTIFDNCEYSGIECICDSGTLLRHNSIIGSDVGILSAFNGNWVVEESMIWLCENGILVVQTDGGFVLRTMIKNCSLIGINLEPHSTNISIVQCWMGPNNAQNAQDDGAGNMWYEEYSQLGNYWSDYLGEGPYTIPGSAESVDLYPTALEDAPSWDDVVIVDNSTNTTTTDDNLIGTSILLVSVASAVIVLLVATAMLRSRVNPSLG